MTARQILKNCIPQAIRQKIKAFISPVSPEMEHATLSFSQEGEDLILRRIFWGKTSGFYVDVGAHHPFRYSNTHHFYRNGWTGINIDPNKELMKEFYQNRPRDINVCAGVSNEKGQLNYYEFTWPEVNGFNARPMLPDEDMEKCKLLNESIVDVLPLSDILDEHLPKNVGIDFMSIDVEGFDLKVLESNDWSKYRPRVLLVEDLDFSMSNAKESAVCSFLLKRNYSPISKAKNTLFFVDNNVGI